MEVVVEVVVVVVVEVVVDVVVEVVVEVVVVSDVVVVVVKVVVIVVVFFFSTVNIRATRIANKRALIRVRDKQIFCILIVLDFVFTARDI